MNGSTGVRTGDVTLGTMANSKVTTGSIR